MNTSWFFIDVVFFDNFICHNQYIIDNYLCQAEYGSFQS